MDDRIGSPSELAGWREAIAIPEICSEPIPVKLDTGARTSAIHAVCIETCELDGRDFVKFELNHHRLARSKKISIPVRSIRTVKNTSGKSETRVSIACDVALGDRKACIELTLADRTNMNFPMILGRSAMRALRLTAHPSRSWLLSQKPDKTRRKMQ